MITGKFLKKFHNFYEFSYEIRKYLILAGFKGMIETVRSFDIKKNIKSTQIS